MQLETIYQYPVKSMMGGAVPTATLTLEGMSGDRAWAIRDEVLGCVRGAKKIGALMQLAAAHAIDGGVTITLPDGAVVHSSEADVNDALSAALGQSVSLWPLQPATDLDHYRRGPGVSDDIMVELRDMFGREKDEPLPDFSKFPDALAEFESPPGTYLDAYPLMLMTTSAMRTLTVALPDSVIDVRRFRPNLIIDTGDLLAHPELDWVGRRFSLGSAVIEMVATCPRCVMVTREVASDLPADRSILRHIVRELNQDLGCYATVVQPGEIRAGDQFVQI